VIPPEYIFNISSVPQRGLNNRTTSLIQGAVVGGGSAVNAMMSDRGSTEDYDTWAQLGNEGWDWKGLLPYFRKVICFGA
jgi:choline dehydrogenase-like flavoprotein